MDSETLLPTEEERKADRQRHAGVMSHVSYTHSLVRLVYIVSVLLKVERLNFLSSIHCLEYHNGVLYGLAFRWKFTPTREERIQLPPQLGYYSFTPSINNVCHCHANYTLICHSFTIFYYYSSTLPGEP